jgi:ribosomal protein L7/L12
MDTSFLMVDVIIAPLVILIVYLLVRQLAEQTQDSTTQRLARIERSLDRIMAHLQIEIEPYPQPNSRVEELVRAGKIFDAVKAYREANRGASLREAKLAVDHLKARLNAE